MICCYEQLAVMVSRGYSHSTGTIMFKFCSWYSSQACILLSQSLLSLQRVLNFHDFSQPKSKLLDSGLSDSRQWLPERPVEVLVDVDPNCCFNSEEALCLLEAEIPSGPQYREDLPLC